MSHGCSTRDRNSCFFRVSVLFAVTLIHQSHFYFRALWEIEIALNSRIPLMGSPKLYRRRLIRPLNIVITVYYS